MLRPNLNLSWFNLLEDCVEEEPFVFSHLIKMADCLLGLGHCFNRFFFVNPWKLHVPASFHKCSSNLPKGLRNLILWGAV